MIEKVENIKCLNFLPGLLQREVFNIQLHHITDSADSCVLYLGSSSLKLPNLCSNYTIKY